MTGTQTVARTDDYDGRTDFEKSLFSAGALAAPKNRSAWVLHLGDYMRYVQRMGLVWASPAFGPRVCGNCDDPMYDSDTTFAGTGSS